MVLDIAERARRRAAAGAWIIDFTNPVGIVTRALLDARHRAVGLCNVAIGFQRSFAAMLGVEPGEVSLDHVGLNHLTWERAVLVNGRDRLPELLATHGPEIVEKTGQPACVLQELGVVPSYYLRYFDGHYAVVAEQRLGYDPRGGGGAAGTGAAGPVRRPGPGPQAGAAGRAGRRLLLGGRRGAAGLAGDRPPRHPGGQRP